MASTARLDELKKKFIETKLSKLVVYEDNIDHLAGYIHQLDLFKKPESLSSIISGKMAVPQSTCSASASLPQRLLTSNHLSEKAPHMQLRTLR